MRKQAVCGFGVSPHCKLVYEFGFVILQSSRLKLDKHKNRMKMSQGSHVSNVTVCFGWEGRLCSSCVSLNRAGCVFIWQCGRVHTNHPGRNLLAHLVPLIPFPLALGFTGGPQLSPQHAARISLFSKTVRSL